MDEQEKIEIIEDFAEGLIENQQDLDPEFAQTLNEGMWDLLNDT